MKTLQDDILKFQERFCYEDEYGNWGIRGDSGVEFHVIEDLLEYLNPYFREPSTEQSGGTEQEEIPNDLWLDYGRDEMAYSFEAAEKRIPNPVDYVRKKMSEKYRITRKP